VHLTSLRTALNEARAATGMAAIAYAQPTLTAGSIVRARRNSWNCAKARSEFRLDRVRMGRHLFSHPGHVQNDRDHSQPLTQERIDTIGTR
jgi:hypothetical protein